MSFNAFEWIQNALGEELKTQGFGEPRPLEGEQGRAAMFCTDEVAYKILYDEKSQRFSLSSASLSESGEPEKWRELSQWLYDSQEGEKGDAESILNDFLEVVRGPKRVSLVQQRKKRGKDDNRNIDPLFFLNRLVNLFPELKEELNEEKIVYGQVRFVTFVKEKVVPKCERLAAGSSESAAVKKLCALLDDMYKNGDMDLRSILTISLLNSLSDQAFTALRDNLGEELQRDLKYTRKLKGKKIKPEKAKKQKKVVAKLDSSRF